MDKILFSNTILRVIVLKIFDIFCFFSQFKYCHTIQHFLDFFLIPSFAISLFIVNSKKVSGLVHKQQLALKVIFIQFDQH